MSNRRLKRVIFVCAAVGCILGLVILSYFYAFRTAYEQVDASDYSKRSLVVMGIHFPYNPTNAHVFCTLFRPLIEKDAETEGQKIVEGPISFPSNFPDAISIGRKGEDILIYVPAELTPSVRTLPTGETVKVIYGFEPIFDSPFCNRYKLVSIKRVASL